MPAVYKALTFCKDLFTQKHFFVNKKESIKQHFEIKNEKRGFVIYFKKLKRKTNVRFYNDPANIIKRSQLEYSVNSPRLSRSNYAHHVLPTTIQLFIRSRHDLTPRLYCDDSPLLPWSYCIHSAMKASFRPGDSAVLYRVSVFLILWPTLLSPYQYITIARRSPQS